MTSTNPPNGGPPPDGDTPDENLEPVPEVPEEEEEDKDRRFLILMIAILGLAAIGLLILLIWLLLPEDRADLPQAEGCPHVVVDAVYGFGVEPNELLLRPLGVTFDDLGNLWVSDTGNSRVLAFDPEGELIREVAGPGADIRVDSPYGLDFDDGSQRLYVADWTLNGILVFTSDGRFTRAFPVADEDPLKFGPNGFTPYEIQVNGSQIVASSNNGLYFFDSDGYAVDRWGGEAPGEQPGEFAFPDAFVVDQTTGNVYVTDTLNKRVVALSADGEVLWIAGTPDRGGETTGFWQLPRAITIGPDGNLYVVDTFRANPNCNGVGHIVVLSPDGDLLSEFGPVGSQEGSFSFPEKIAVAPDGRFAIADRENNRVQIFTIEGVLPPPDSLEVDMYESSFQRFDN